MHLRDVLEPKMNRVNEIARDQSLNKTEKLELGLIANQDLHQTIVDFHAGWNDYENQWLTGYRKLLKDFSEFQDKVQNKQMEAHGIITDLEEEGDQEEMERVFDAMRELMDLYARYRSCVEDRKQIIDELPDTKKRLEDFMVEVADGIEIIKEALDNQ